MNMKLKKILDDIQKTEDKIAELQEHLKRLLCGMLFCYGCKSFH